MAVGRSDLPRLLSIPGITWGTARAGIKHPDRDDLAVMEIAPGSSCAAVFTRNAFCAAPVTVAREALAVASPRFLLVNSGNANAGTGAAGLADARHCCAVLAGQAACRVEAVLPFSTGVIGERLPVERIEDALPQALGTLADDGWGRAAHAIMTTDTVPKGAAREIDIAGRPVRVTGIAKGAGMIRPDMATMLAFVATDAGVSQPDLQAMLRLAVERSFNRITVDGDTSTNDACVLVATGASGVDLAGDATGLAQLAEAVDEVCRRLAQAIVRDGEGATKFVTITVQGGRDSRECLQVAYTVAHSPLVKTALFASDPNWGRILAAVGRSGVEGLDVGRIDIDLGDVALIRGGEPDPGYSEAAGAAVMAKPEITITIGLGRGKAHEQVWTTDLSYDYVRINAEYRT